MPKVSLNIFLGMDNNKAMITKMASKFKVNKQAKKPYAAKQVQQKVKGNRPYLPNKIAIYVSYLPSENQ